MLRAACRSSLRRQRTTAAGVSPIDPESAGDYWAAADRILATPPTASERDASRELARRYAVLFFFRFHNVLDAVTEDGRSRPRIRATAASDLDSGVDPALDRVVTGILDGIAPIAPPGDSNG